MVHHSCGMFSRRLLSKPGGRKHEEEREEGLLQHEQVWHGRSLLKMDSKGKVDFKEDLRHPNTLGDKAYR